MRTNKERQQLIYRRTLELRSKERRKKQCMFSVWCSVMPDACYRNRKFHAGGSEAGCCRQY